MTEYSEYINLNSNVYRECNSIEEKFDILTSFLLKDIVLIIAGEEYSLEEIELYYYSNNHRDRYTHRSADQLQNSKWYFHKFKNGSYKGGTYKGLDITIGNGIDAYGGILLRSIMNINTNMFIQGPCKIVDHIIEQTENGSLQELINEMNDLDVFNKKNEFYLKHNKKSGEKSSETIFSGPRVGLSLKFPKYLIKNYRFIKKPNKIVKYRNTIISSLYYTGMDANKIHKITKISMKSIKDSIEDFDKGVNMTEDEIKNIPISKINILYGYYKNFYE